MNFENPLVVIRDNRATTTSLIVADVFGKLHKNVIRDIKALECSDQFNRLNFEPVDYMDAKGEKRPMYEMTKDGFTMLAFGFTGSQAAAWKEKYIAAFNLMEETISGLHGVPWKNALAAFHSFYPASRLVCCSKSSAVKSANAATKSLTGVDLMGLMNIGHHGGEFENTTLLNGLARLMDADNLKVRGTFKRIIGRLALIVSPDRDGMPLPTPRSFRTQLERIRTSLAEIGITFEYGKKINKGLVIEFTRQPAPVSPAYQSPVCINIQ
jgi:Rha family phage regulatory protein